jgi:hypothetical protein
LHARSHALEIDERQAFFEDESRRDRARQRSADRKIVHGAADREPPDVAAGKERRANDEAVRRERQPSVRLARRDEDRLIFEACEDVAAKVLEKYTLQQLGGEPAAAPVSEHDRVVLALRQRASDHPSAPSRRTRGR